MATFIVKHAQAQSNGMNAAVIFDAEDGPAAIAASIVLLPSWAASESQLSAAELTADQRIEGNILGAGDTTRGQ